MLTPQEAESLFETLRVMADEGRTIIFISHKLHEVKAVSDRVTVLRGGQDDRDRRHRRRDAALARGADGRARGRRSPRASSARSEVGEPVLEVEDALGAGRPRRRRAARRRPRRSARGEIVAIAGVAGQRPARARRDDHRHARADARRDRASAARRLRGGDAARGDPRRASRTCRRTGSHTGVAPSLSIAVERRAQVVPRPARRRAGRCSGCARSASTPAS